MGKTAGAVNESWGSLWGGDVLNSIDPVCRPGEIVARVEAVLRAAGGEEYLYHDGNPVNEGFLHQAAYRMLAQAYEKRPDDTGVLNSMGLCYIRLGEYELALNCHKTQCERNKGEWVGWNNVAWCEMRLGRSEAGLHAIEKALELRHEQANLEHTWGAILFQLHHYDQSISVVNAAIERHGDQAPELHYLLAVEFSELEAKSEAVEMWNRYLRVVRGFVGHDQAVGRALRELEALGAKLEGGVLTEVLRSAPACFGVEQGVRALRDRLGISGKGGGVSGQIESERKAGKLARKGWMLLQKGKGRSARGRCLESLALWPMSPLGRILDARLCLQEKTFDRYDDYVVLANVEQKCCDLGNKDRIDVGMFVLGLCLVNAERLYHAGDYKRALGQLDEFWPLLRDTPDGEFLRILILIELERFEEARRGIDRFRKGPGGKGGGGRRGCLMLEKMLKEKVMRSVAARTPREVASASSPIEVRRW